MAAFSAFQRNAFQNNAFQIGAVPVGGHYLPVYGHYKKQPLGNIQLIYKEIKEAVIADEEIAEIIAPYTEQEIKGDILPVAEKIDFELLARNEMAMDGFIQQIENIQKRIELLKISNAEDEDLLFIASIIN